MQQWGYQVHAMVSSESIPWLWIIFHSIKLRPVCSSFEGNTLFSVAIPRWLSTLYSMANTSTAKPYLLLIAWPFYMNDFLRHPTNLPTIANCKFVCHIRRRSVPLPLSKAIISMQYQFHVAPSPNFANLITMRLADTCAVISYSQFSNSPSSIPSIYCQLHSFLPHRHP